MAFNLWLWLYLRIFNIKNFLIKITSGFFEFKNTKNPLLIFNIIYHITIYLSLFLISLVIEYHFANVCTTFQIFNWNNFKSFHILYKQSRILLCSGKSFIVLQGSARGHESLFFNGAFWWVFKLVNLLNYQKINFWISDASGDALDNINWNFQRWL